MIVAALVSAGLAAWMLWPDPEPPPPGTAQELPPSKIEKQIEYRDRVIEKITIRYLPAQAKVEAGLPTAAATNDAELAIASKTLKAEDRDYILTATLNEETGVGLIYATPQPLPWFRPESDLHITLAGGYAGDKLGTPEPVITGALQWDVVQVKRMHVGATGIADTSGRWFAGVGVRVDF